MDLTDAALRERADAISRKCGTWDAVPSEAAMRFVAEECYHAFIALRDAARTELAVVCQRHGCMWEAPEAHETCRAEQRERDAKAIRTLINALTLTAVPWDRKGTQDQHLQWDAILQGEK